MSCYKIKQGSKVPLRLFILLYSQENYVLKGNLFMYFFINFVIRFYLLLEI